MPHPTHAVHSAWNPVRVTLRHNLEFGDTLRVEENVYFLLCKASSMAISRSDFFSPFASHRPHLCFGIVTSDSQDTSWGERRVTPITSPRIMFLPNQQCQHHLGACMKHNFLDLNADLLMRKSRMGRTSCLSRTSR